MTVVPALIPVTVPASMPDDVTVAIAALPLLQVPPATVLLSKVVIPVHAVLLPVIVAGSGCTVTTLVVLQPVDNA